VNNQRARLRGSGVLSAVGETPLIQLSRLLDDRGRAVYAKLEALNPGGSLKDRSARAIVEASMETGEIVPHETVVVESSSGNFAIGLAQACRYYGVEFICVVDVKTPAESIAILRAFGAEVDIVTEPDAATNEYLPVRLRRVADLLATIRNSFWPNQYANPAAARAHHRTMDEIAQALDGRVDYLFCATSTCGTLRGCSEYVSQHGLTTQIIAVDAAGSAVFDSPRQPRLIPGHGASIRPELYRDDLAAEVVHVTDQDCILGCWRLLDREAYLGGGSSGGLVAALDRVHQRLPKSTNCVLMFADRGERYLSTIYNDVWVEQHFNGLRESVQREVRS
jgi:N-(2-amino-2-carboxyethyl)-L-glutamate synthase